MATNKYEKIFYSVTQEQYNQLKENEKINENAIYFTEEKEEDNNQEGS